MQTMKHEIKAPKGAMEVINRLEKSGHEAWLVGGCVRDLLMGLNPKDWDVTTSATPSEVKACFGGKRLIETGIKHGTLTVVSCGLPIEVTTYRTDGDYMDNRRPESVTFTKDLRGDLSRRDFTINAMAWNPARGLVDEWGGMLDLEAGLLRAIGNPDERLHEDGLRIMRALRFASTLGFTVDEGLSGSLRRNRLLLENISAERIAAELMKALAGPEIQEILMGYPEIFSVFIPEIRGAVGFEQISPHHDRDLWAHTATSVAGAIPDPTIRLTMLFHDLGKPAAASMVTKGGGEDKGDGSFVSGSGHIPGHEDKGDDSFVSGSGHIPGHEKIGAKIAFNRLKAMKFDNAAIETVTTLIRWHDVIIYPEKIPKWLNILGEGKLEQLFEVKLADAAAHKPSCQEKRIEEIAILRDEVAKVLAEGPCFSLKELSVSGADLIAAGIPEGKAVGETLNCLLEEVMERRLPNERAALLKAAKEPLCRNAVCK